MPLYTLLFFCIWKLTYHPLIHILITQVDVPAPAVLQPAADLSLVPPADTPEAAFDMIAAANLQPAATLELDPAPDPDTEELAAAADPEDILNSEPEANVDQVLPQEEVEDEEIPLEEVNLDHCTFSKRLSSVELFFVSLIWSQNRPDSKVLVLQLKII